MEHRARRGVEAVLPDAPRRIAVVGGIGRVHPVRASTRSMGAIEDMPQLLRHGRAIPGVAGCDAEAGPAAFDPRGRNSPRDERVDDVRAQARGAQAMEKEEQLVPAGPASPAGAVGQVLAELEGVIAGELDARDGKGLPRVIEGLQGFRRRRRRDLQPGAAVADPVEAEPERPRLHEAERLLEPGALDPAPRGQVGPEAGPDGERPPRLVPRKAEVQRLARIPSIDPPRRAARYGSIEARGRSPGLSVARSAAPDLAA